MSWAQKRRAVYIFIVIIILILLGIWIYNKYFYFPPTCFDNKQNQDEQGIDCGGVCTILCNGQYAPLNVLWSRFSMVNDGVYNVLAYIVNSNLQAGANNVQYVFKLYDQNGFLLTERFGKTFIPPNKVLAVFEPDLLTGKYAPARVDFTFITNPVWLKQDSQEANISINETNLTQVETAPRLSATLTNKTVNLIKNIEAVGIVYDVNGNTLNFSRTIIDNLGDKVKKSIYFNWPKPFALPAARTEIILRVLN